MNNQYLCNKPISVSYAFKKDGNGERHGSPAESPGSTTREGEKGMTSTSTNPPQYTPQPQQYYQMMMPYMNQMAINQPGMMQVSPQASSPSISMQSQNVYKCLQVPLPLLYTQHMQCPLTMAIEHHIKDIHNDLINE